MTDANAPVISFQNGSYTWSKMAQILIAGRDWTTRALLRAQLIEEDVDVEACENIGDAVRRLEASRDMPSLLIADLFESDKFREEVAALANWANLVPIWILAMHGSAGTASLESQGFERVLLRPLDLGKLVHEIKDRLVG